MLLLGAEACNAFHLFDASEVIRGSLMYPQASLINHSCYPSMALYASRDALVLEALRDVHTGEELTYCYVRSFKEGARETLDPWGFLCDCPRCTHAVSDEELQRFDQAHRCACGKIVVERKARRAKEMGACCCHEENTV